MNKTFTITSITLLIFFSASAFSQDTTKPEFKASGKLWGLAFGDYFYKVHADSSSRGNAQYSNMAKDYNAFEFRRIYLGYNYDISEKFSAELLLAYQGQTLIDNTRTVYIKSANLRWKNIWKNTDLLIGQSQTPMWPLLSEKVWNYRSVEKTIPDMHKLGTDNDMGIALQSKIITNDKTEVGYNLMIGNGTAQKIETDKFKKMYGDVYAKILNKKIIFDLYGDYERSQLSPYMKSKMTMKVLLAYQSDKITIGVEAVQQVQEKSVSYVTPAGTVIDNIIVLGVGGYIRGQIIKDKLNFFIRQDIYIPNTNTPSYLYKSEEDFSIAGFDYMPSKNIHIIPNVWYNSYYIENPALPAKSRRDYDMVPRLTVYYIFK